MVYAVREVLHELHKGSKVIVYMIGLIGSSWVGIGLKGRSST